MIELFEAVSKFSGIRKDADQVLDADIVRRCVERVVHILRTHPLVADIDRTFLNDAGLAGPVSLITE